MAKIKEVKRDKFDKWNRPDSYLDYEPGEDIIDPSGYVPTVRYQYRTYQNNEANNR